MATDKPRFSISMDEETFEKVIAYKEENGIATQSKAVIKIMEMGLRDLEREAAQKKSSGVAEAAPEDKVFKVYDYLNKALVSAGLIQDGEDITDQQAEILLAVCNILRAAFEERD